LNVLPQGYVAKCTIRWNRLKFVIHRAQKNSESLPSKGGAEITSMRARPEDITMTK